MTHAYFPDLDRPTVGRWTPRAEHEVLAAARDRIRDLPTDHEGNLHVSDVLDALHPDGLNG